MDPILIVRLRVLMSFQLEARERHTVETRDSVQQGILEVVRH
jgi:hypothetical protein